MKRGLRSATALSSAICFILVSASAAAQSNEAQTGPTPGVDAAVPDNASTEEAVSDGAIIVTGSRISRRDYSADSPIVSVGQAAIQAAGPSTLEAALNELPQFTSIRPGSTLSGARQGRNNANLRGLGISRTLVLLDGRRMQPSDALGTIDLNTIPSALIENVEVITGGASAVYGSDAIAGVVNFKLRRNFKGLELDGQYGITDRGDSPSWEVSATFGGEFADSRGRIDLSMGYLDRGYSQRKERDFFLNSGVASNLTGALIQADAANLPTQAALNQVFGSYGLQGPARNATLSANVDGSLFTPNSPVRNFRYPENGLYRLINGRVGIPYGETYALQAPLQRFNVFGRASYEVTDTIEAFAQFSHVQYSTTFDVFGGSVRELTIPVTNPFIPADLRTILASRRNPNAPLIYNFTTGKLGRTIIETDYNVNQYLVGLRGKLGIKDWTWELYGSYGRTDQDATYSGRIDRGAINSLINAPDGGNSICAGGFNPFSPTIIAEDPAQSACFDYLHRSARGHTNFKQRVVEATMQGGLLELPAGEVRFAAGASYRKNSFGDEPPSEFVNATLVGFTRGQVLPASGSIAVKELFGEVLIPVLHDLPLIKSLAFDLAYRYSHYDTIGSAHTYKATAEWEMFDFLRLRGGFQQAIRAPSLGETYAQDSGGQGLIGSTASGQGDPCDVTGLFRTGPNAAQVRALCVASGVPENIVDIFRFSGSSVPTRNPISLGLEEERARTFTLGGVIQSPVSSALLRGLSLSIDYYNITVSDAIGTITAPVTLSQCFNSNGSNSSFSASNIFCQQIQRDAGGNISEVLTPRLNLASYKTSGIDVQFDWNADVEAFGLGDNGRIGLNLLVSYLDSYKIQNIAGASFADYAGTIGNAQIDEFTISYPKWKLNATVSYGKGPFNVALKARWIDKMYNSQDAGLTTRTRPGVAARTYFDLTTRVGVTESFELRAGVLNLADKQPPVWTGEGATDLALYDVLGRRFYMGARLKF